MHIETIEARRLFAATLDATFGTGGNLAFPLDRAVLNVLATGGEVYVQVYQRPRERIVIFKYNEDGTLDTAWGRGGYVVPKFTSNNGDGISVIDELTLVRDGRTGGLLVGDVNQTYAGIRVERYTSTGQLDTAWGDSGAISYSENRTELTLDAVIALPQKQVMLAFEREQQKAERTYDLGTKGGADDVALLKFDKRGRYDKAFNGGHALTVAIGNYSGTSTGGRDLAPDRTDVENFSSPTFGDIQFFNDGSFRVISLRDQTQQTTTVENFDSFSTIGRTVYSVESTNVSANGVLRKRPSQAYVLKRIEMDNNVDTVEPNFRPQAAAASADGVGVSVLFNTLRSASLLQIGPNGRGKPERLPGPFSTRGVGSVVRSGSGDFVAQSYSDRGFGLLNLGLNLTLGRARVITPETDLPTNGLYPYTADDSGRLLGRHTDIDNNVFLLSRYV